MSSLAAPHLKQWIEDCPDYELCETFIEETLEDHEGEVH